MQQPFVVRSFADVPPHLLTPGVLIGVSNGYDLDLYRIVRAPRAQGLGDIDWGQIIQSGVQAGVGIATAYAGRARGGSSGGGAPSQPAPFSRPDGRFVKFADAETVYRVSDWHPFANPAEAAASGVDTGSWSNVQLVQTATPANLLARGSQTGNVTLPSAGGQPTGGGQTTQPREDEGFQLPAWAVPVGLGAVALWFVTRDRA